MPNKILTIGAAVAVAALVLLLTVFVGGPRSGTKDQAPTTSDAPLNVYVPGGTVDGESLIGEATGILYEISESGILFYADRVIPLPQGVVDVIKTTAQIHLGPGKEITIVADEGTIVAPDNHPREGEMRGNVVVTLYETPDGSPVDFKSDKHVVIRTYFDEPLHFDMELQQLESAGPIFMTGPQVQFRGKGLSLNYNQLRHRIQRLVIEEGESLHYIPKPTTNTSTTTPAPAEADSSAVASHDQSQPRSKPTNASTNASAANTTDNTSTTEPDTQPDTTVRPIQFYLATFEELQDVRVGQDQYIIQGDDLSAIFSTKAAGGRDDTSPPDSPDDPTEASTTRTSPAISNHSIQLASSDPLRGALLYTLAASIGQVPQADSRSLASFTDQDVVITWAGRLVVSPLSDPPDELAGPDDVRVSVKGKPTTISTDQGETILAPSVSYFTQNARMLAQGSINSPVKVNAPDMGQLTGQELSIDQLNATGYVLGPGQLTGQIKNKPDTPNPPVPSPDTRSPILDTRPITVAFDTRLDLEFYLKNKASQQRSETPGGGGGGDNPAASSRIKGVKTATFLGNVAVDYIDLDMTADSLTLALIEDTPQGDDQLAVSSLDALGNIKANIKDQDVKILAHRLHAEPAKDQLELFGTPGSPKSPALVIRPDATLAGDHIIMDQQARTVTVPGPGWFDAVQDIDDPGKTIRVTWATRMDYDDAAGTAHFLGNVKTLSVDGTDTNELMGNDLTLVFVVDEATGDRRLATATMLENVRFRARSYATAKQQKLLTELFLTDSQKMVFTDPGPTTNAPADSPQALQQVHVFGNGRMLITENRPKDPATASAKADNNKSIDFAGRGLTAFQWAEGLILNMTDGIMTMKGAVVMVHDSEDGDRVQLDCHDLAAELRAPAKSRKKKTPGAGGGWLAKDAPKPELQRVWADGNIRILQGPNTVYCDHLLYQESKREIILWSDDPRQVTFEKEGEPNLTKASAFKWHRDSGRIEVFKIKSGTIPIRRSEQDTHQ